MKSPPTSGDFSMSDYRLYHTVFRTVCLNPGISLNHLVWLVSSKLGEDQEKIREIAENLMYKDQDFVVRCINYFKIPKEKTKKGIDVFHLRKSERNGDAAEECFSKLQESLGYEVPEILVNKSYGEFSSMKRASHAVLQKT